MQAQHLIALTLQNFIAAVQDLFFSIYIYIYFVTQLVPFKYTTAVCGD